MNLATTSSILNFSLIFEFIINVNLYETELFTVVVRLHNNKLMVDKAETPVGRSRWRRHNANEDRDFCLLARKMMLISIFNLPNGIDNKKFYSFFLVLFLNV